MICNPKGKRMATVLNLSDAAAPLYSDYLAKKAIRLADDGKLSAENAGIASDQAAIASAQAALIARQTNVAALQLQDNGELQAENDSLTALVNQLLIDLKAIVPPA
jgi:hypothetical protein